jgi:hypothetical protein
MLPSTPMPTSGHSSTARASDSPRRWTRLTLDRSYRTQRQTPTRIRAHPREMAAASALPQEVRLLFGDVALRLDVFNVSIRTVYVHIHCVVSRHRDIEFTGFCPAAARGAREIPPELHVCCAVRTASTRGRGVASLIDHRSVSTSLRHSCCIEAASKSSAVSIAARAHPYRNTAPSSRFRSARPQQTRQQQPNIPASNKSEGEGAMWRGRREERQTVTGDDDLCVIKTVLDHHLCHHPSSALLPAAAAVTPTAMAAWCIIRV